MIANFGYGVFVITFLVTLYGIAAALIGIRWNSQKWVDSARSAMLLTFPLILLGSACIVYLLVTGHYEVQYVYNVTSNSMPTYLKVTALWGGQAGSLVFWSFLLSAFASAVCLRNWSRDREFLPWVIIVCLVTLAFFLMMTILYENPFVRFWQTGSGEQITAMFQPAGASAILPGDGRGLNPLLRHPGMVIHPPMLYLGFVSFVIPFAFAIAALATGRSDDRWIRITRRWSLIAWLFLSLGLVLGSRWAYDVLGWGGYWGWDPVEIAAFMPWLTGTALIHSVMIQEKTGLFKRWNMILTILTYSLVIYGTFLTRSGVLSSVHAFSQSEIGPMFFTFIGLSLAISIYLLMTRWYTLKDEGQMHSLLSREAFFLLNNLLFMSLFVICFWGVNFPLMSELLTGQKVTVGPPFYERATGPVFLLLLLLMGLAPLTAWGHSTWKTLGRAVWKPLAFSLVAAAAVLIVGVRQPLAVLAFWMLALITAVIVMEFYRGVRARHRSSGENYLSALSALIRKNRRRYGGYFVHLGVVFMALGIIGIEMFQAETQGTLKVGETLSLRNYSITYKSLAEFDTPDGRSVARAVVDVQRDGKPLGELYPRSDYYYEAQQSMTIPGVRSTMEDDLYVLLVDWEAISTSGVTFKVFHNPLINWLWLGGIVFFLATLVAAWPDRDPEVENIRRKATLKPAAEPAGLK
jgi:cytochrome c-type biogenesis protein CcmF